MLTVRLLVCFKGIASLQTTKSSFTASYLTISKGVKHNSCLTEENLSSFNEELSKQASKPAVVVVAVDDESTEVLSEAGLEEARDSDSDTSDDASDIPDSECLDDLASLEDLEDPVAATGFCAQPREDKAAILVNTYSLIGTKVI